MLFLMISSYEGVKGNIWKINRWWNATDGTLAFLHLGADGQPHHLKKVNLANDMQVLQDRVITENRQRYSISDIDLCLFFFFN